VDQDDVNAATRWEGAQAGFEAARRPALREDTSWKTAKRRPWFLRDMPVFVFVVFAVSGIIATVGLVIASLLVGGSQVASGLLNASTAIGFLTLLIAVITSNLLWRQRTVRRGGDDDPWG
jgi:hypothetical protein